MAGKFKLWSLPSFSEAPAPGYPITLLPRLSTRLHILEQRIELKGWEARRSGDPRFTSVDTILKTRLSGYSHHRIQRRIVLRYLYTKQKIKNTLNRKDVNTGGAEEKSKRRTDTGEQARNESSRHQCGSEVRSMEVFVPETRYKVFVQYQESSTPARSANGSSRRRDMFSGISMVKLLPVEPEREREETGEAQEEPETQGEPRPSGG